MINTFLFGAVALEVDDARRIVRLLLFFLVGHGGIVISFTNVVSVSTLTCFVVSLFVVLVFVFVSVGLFTREKYCSNWYDIVTCPALVCSWVCKTLENLISFFFEQTRKLLL